MAATTACPAHRHATECALACAYAGACCGGGAGRRTAEPACTGGETAMEASARRDIRCRSVQRARWRKRRGLR